jgi:hypothetical protein
MFQRSNRRVDYQPKASCDTKTAVSSLLKHQNIFVNPRCLVKAVCHDDHLNGTSTGIVQAVVQQETKSLTSPKDTKKL